MDTASVGLVRRVENMVADTPNYRDELNRRHEHALTRIGELEAVADEPFEHTDAVRDKRHRLDTLTAAHGVGDSDTRGLVGAGVGAGPGDPAAGQGSSGVPHAVRLAYLGQGNPNTAPIGRGEDVLGRRRTRPQPEDRRRDEDRGR